MFILCYLLIIIVCSSCVIHWLFYNLKSNHTALEELTQWRNMFKSEIIKLPFKMSEFSMYFIEFWNICLYLVYCI